MNFKKISIIVITIISIFSFNNKVDAAQELTCFYNGNHDDDELFDKDQWLQFAVMFTQDNNGNQKYYYGYKANGIFGHVWYLTGEKQSGKGITREGLGKDVLIKYDSDGVYESCPKYNYVDYRDSDNTYFYITNEDIKQSSKIYRHSLTETKDYIATIHYMNSSTSYKENNNWVIGNRDNYTKSCLYAYINSDDTDFLPGTEYIQIDYNNDEIRVNSTINKSYELTKNQIIAYKHKVTDTREDGLAGLFEGFWNWASGNNSEYRDDTQEAYNIIQNKIGRESIEEQSDNMTTCPMKMYINIDKGTSGKHIDYKIKSNDSNDIELPLIQSATKGKDDADTVLTGIEYTSISKITNCSDIIPEEILKYIKTILNIIRIGVPIMIVALTMIDLSKSIFNGEEDMKKAKDKIIKRLIIAAAFFLVPTILKAFLDIVSFIWPSIDPTLCGIFD